MNAEGSAQLDPGRPIEAYVHERASMLGLSPRTAKTYAWKLAAFERWSGEAAVSASLPRLLAFMAHEQQRRPGSTTASQARNAVAFLLHQVRGQVEVALPAPPRRRIREVEVPDPQTVAAAFAGIEDARARLFCEFVYGTGMRLREARLLRVADLDLRRLRVLVREPKGNRERITILPASLAPRLQARIALYRPEHEVFGSGLGHLAGRTVRHHLALGSAKAGLLQPLHPHQLRHCFATHLSERGAAVHEIGLLLGHRNILTTMRYLHFRNARRDVIAREMDLLAHLPRQAMSHQAELEDLLG